MSIPIRKALYGKLASDTILNGSPASAGNGLLGARPTGKNIFFSFAPDGIVFPYVIFSKSAGTPSYTFEPRAGTVTASSHPPTWSATSVQSQAAYDNELWLVKGVAHDGPEVTAEDPMTDADSIAQRIDWLLTNETLSISGATSLYLRRESDVEYAETSDGEVYYHAGALYRLMYSATT